MLNKVVDYRILTSYDPEMLEELVKDSLKGGWTPSGPLFTYKNNINQAMVKFGR
jgi:hypothetical protein